MKKFTPFAIFWQFLGLGLMSFGGPIAHIGYFQKTFVERLRWLDQATFMQLTTLCQLLPGPASSQLGFAIGLKHGGLGGALAAFLGFTLPSFILMACLAIYAPAEQPWVHTTLLGLKLAAVVVVADACWSLFIRFCDTPYRKGIAAVTTLALLVFPAQFTQILLLAVAALAGEKPNWRALTQRAEGRRRPAVNWLFISFALLLLAGPLLALAGGLGRLWAGFYQSGSLVFGGGHVVLPLLQQFVGDSLDNDHFLLGYASVQAVPGPMFTFASFLGAELTPNQPWLGAVTATIAIFTPGFLLVLATVKGWQSSWQQSALQPVFARVNAAVVGLLLAAFLQPVLVTGVTNGVDTTVAVVGLILVRTVKLSVLWLLLGMVATAWLRSFL